MASDSITETVKCEMRASLKMCVPLVSSLANCNLLKYLSVYKLKQNCALLPTRLFAVQSAIQDDSSQCPLDVNIFPAYVTNSMERDFSFFK